MRMPPALAATAHISDLVAARAERESEAPPSTATRRYPARAETVAAERAQAAEHKRIDSAGKAALMARYDETMHRCGAAAELLRCEAENQIARLEADAALNIRTTRVYTTPGLRD